MPTATRSFLRLMLMALSFAYLAALPGGAQETAGIARPTPPESQGAADAVFAEEGYRQGLDTSHTTLEDIIDLLFHWMGKTWKDFIAGLESLLKAYPVLGWLTFAAMIVVLLLLIWHIVWTFTRAFKGPSASDGDGEATADANRARRYRDLRAEAMHLADAGDPREGIRSLLLALLALLAEEHVLTVARSWTPRETLGRVGARVNEVGLSEMKSFQTVVEDALYGSQDVTPQAFTDCCRLLDLVVRALRSLPRRSS